MANPDRPHDQLIHVQTPWESLEVTVEANRNKIVVAIIVTILLIAVYTTVSWISNSANDEESNRWTTLSFIQQPGPLQEFAKNNLGTNQAIIAKVEAARVLLGMGMTNYATNNTETKKEATNNLEKAIELYDAVISDALVMPELKAQALLNAGKAHEAMLRFDKAKDFYTQASALELKTGSGVLAAKYLKNLQETQPDMVGFYKNFE